MKIKKIISGGQTGADQGALDIAIKLGIPHGGWIPKGRLTEDGPLPDKYALNEMPTASYPKRTEKNILDSDGTMILSYGPLAGGSSLTMKLAKKHKKPVFHLDLNSMFIFKAVEDVNAWISEYQIEVLNVAGSRASKDPEIHGATMDFIEVIYNLSIIETETEYIKQKEYPKTINEAVEHLIAELPLKDRTHITGLQEHELIELHFSLGMHIRNEYGLLSDNEDLIHECIDVAEDSLLQADTASFIIIKALWKELIKTHRIRIVGTHQS